MSTKPLVSVIIPAYNEEKYISACLKSISLQTFPRQKYETIVVDNNSSDQTQSVVRKNFPQVRLVKEKKQGVVFARIKGIVEAKGKIIAFIDADSIAQENWLKNLVDAYRDPEVVAVGGLVQYRPKALMTYITEVYDYFYYHFLNLPPASNLSMRISAYKKCGGFSPEINVGESEYIISKIKKEGKVILLKKNIVTTSSRRLTSWDIISFSFKYLLGSLATILFKKQIFFNFKPIRDRGFLNFDREFPSQEKTSSLNKQLPLISVIVPAYNEEDYISGCLDSLLNQDFGINKYEVIVVNNASKDRTAEIAKNKGVKVVIENRKGYVHAITKGVASSNGKIVAFTDADCLVSPDWLSKIWDHFKNDPKLDAVGGKFNFYDTKPLVQQTMNFFSLHFVNEISGANMAIKKQSLLNFGGFDLSTNLAPDILLSMKIKHRGKLLIDKNLVVETSARRYSSHLVREALKNGVNYFYLKTFHQPLFFNFSDIRPTKKIITKLRENYNFAWAFRFSLFVIAITISTFLFLSHPKNSQAWLDKKPFNKTEEFFREKITTLKKNSKKFNSDIKKIFPKVEQDNSSSVER